VKQTNIYTEEETLRLSSCTLCPRRCKTNRFEGPGGYCKTDAGLNISTVCIHRGEEPVISGKEGICNIFFAGCNLRCIYCQNHEISQCRTSVIKVNNDFDLILDQIESILGEGIPALGFVSPSHVIPQVKAILRGLQTRGFKPITVYNTNGYDTFETIRSLDGLIDVYLPDFKYATSDTAKAFSDASDYPEVAFRAIKEMYYQKGSTLLIDEHGRAENGLLIRHLVLPGHAEESKKVLRIIADELSPGIHLSLMSQYHPTASVADHPILSRSLYKEEYDEVLKEMERLGFRNGWVQDMDSNVNYRPDFRKENPFE
jgi:putative pyruvate formate lyase activating enzyme